MKFRERSWSVSCPHCSKEFLITVEMKSEELLPPAEKPTPSRFSDDEAQFLRKVTELGLLDAFTQTVNVAKGEEIPKDIERFFLTWLSTSKPLIIPRDCLDILIERFPNSQIRIVGAQGILMVLANSQPKLFVPAAYAGASKVQKRHPGIVLPNDTRELCQWIRTKNGYVAGKGLFWEELKGRSAGEFARPVL